MIPKLNGFSIIGLGDLIIPGIACSFCLRIDLIRAYNKEPKLSVKGLKIPKNWSKTLYRVSTLAFAFGLLSAQIAFTFTQKPQPALLYIEPIILLSVLVVERKEVNLW